MLITNPRHFSSSQWQLGCREVSTGVWRGGQGGHRDPVFSDVGGGWAGNVGPPQLLWLRHLPAPVLAPPCIWNILVRKGGQLRRQDWWWSHRRRLTRLRWNEWWGNKRSNFGFHPRDSRSAAVSITPPLMIWPVGASIWHLASLTHSSTSTLPAPNHHSSSFLLIIFRLPFS